MKNRLSPHRHSERNARLAGEAGSEAWNLVHLKT